MKRKKIMIREISKKNIENLNLGIKTKKGENYFYSMTSIGSHTNFKIYNDRRSSDGIIYKKTFEKDDIVKSKILYALSY